MKAKTKKTLMIVGAVGAVAVVAYYLLAPRFEQTAALYIPAQCPTGAGVYAYPGMYVCNSDGDTRCF